MTDIFMLVLRIMTQGKAQGEYLREVFPEGASILYFTGAPNDQQYIDRKQGLEDALKGSNITILGEYNVENAKDLGMSTADDCLLSYDSFDAIVCQNDDEALGVVEALKSAENRTAFRCSVWTEVMTHWNLLKTEK